MTKAPKSTLLGINKRLAPMGVELVKGEGYFYFVGAPVEKLPSTSIMVFRLNQLTSDQWVETAEKMIAKQKEQSS